MEGQTVLASAEDLAAHAINPAPEDVPMVSSLEETKGVTTTLVQSQEIQQHPQPQLQPVPVVVHQDVTNNAAPVNHPMEILDVKMKMENPWAVGSLDDFLHYCCPECDTKCQSKESFINHALVNHPQAKTAIPDLVLQNEEAEQQRHYASVKAEPEEDPDFTLDEDLDYEVEKATKKRKSSSKSRRGRPKRSIVKTPPPDLDPDSQTQCYYCGEMMTVAEAFPHMRENHGRPNRRMHGPPRPFQCQQCKGTFDKEETLTNHCCYNTAPVVKGENGLFVCHICRKTFKARKGLKYHLTTFHVEERNFPCTQCDFKAKNLLVLNRHVRRIHNKEVNHFCPHCGKAFMLAYFMKKHVEDVHLKAATKKSEGVKGEFKCNECPEIFDTVQGRARHQKSAHPEKRNDVKTPCQVCGKRIHAVWMEEHMRLEHPGDEALAEVKAECSDCSIGFDSASELNDHTLNDHKDKVFQTYKCIEDCNSNFQSSAAAKRHVAEHHKKLMYVCDECPFMTKYHNLMEFHKAENHLNLGRTDQFSCDLCGRQLKNLDIHMRRDHKPIELPCDQCDAKLDGTEELNDHVVQVHGMPNQMLQCQECPSLWASEYTLSKHSSEDHLPGYTCDICGQVLKAKANLAAHIKHIHEGKYEYACHLCGKTFANANTLNGHITRIHEDGGNYLCDRCDFKGLNKRRLDRHMQVVHLKTTKFPCEECQFVCYNQTTLKMHVRSVHLKIRPFKCDHCDRGFVSRRDRARHMDKQHQVAVN